MKKNMLRIQGQVIDAQPIDPGLYIVSTPIGNLDDITIRALKILAACDVIACEDTRHTHILTRQYGIETRRISYNEHNAKKRTDQIIKKIKDGGAVALVSDAGTPVVSDPGERLVKETAEEGLNVFVAPGPNAALAALVGSGLNAQQYKVAGFLGYKKNARKKMLQKFAEEETTVIIYESPNRIQDTLNDAVQIFGENANACVAREITKRYETFHRGTLKNLANAIRNPKGEIVLVIEGQKQKTKKFSEGESEKMLKDALKKMKPAKAAAHVAKQVNEPKKDLYQKAIKLKEK